MHAGAGQWGTAMGPQIGDYRRLMKHYQLVHNPNRRTKNPDSKPSRKGKQPSPPKERPQTARPANHKRRIQGQSKLVPNSVAQFVSSQIRQHSAFHPPKKPEWWTLIAVKWQRYLSIPQHLRTREDLQWLHVFMTRTLAKIQFFNKVRPLLMYNLCRYWEVQQIPPGFKIWDEGDFPDYFYYIQAGSVNVYGRVRTQVGGQYVTINTLSSTIFAGQAFGELAMVEEKPRTTSCSAAEKTILIRLHRDGYNDVFTTKPAYIFYNPGSSAEKERKEKEEREELERVCAEEVTIDDLPFDKQIGQEDNVTAVIDSIASASPSTANTTITTTASDTTEQSTGEGPVFSIEVPSQTTQKISPTNSTLSKSVPETSDNHQNVQFSNSESTSKLVALR